MDGFNFKHPQYAPVWRRRAEMLTKIRADPALLAACKMHYRNNPWDFCTDWGVTTDPRNANRDEPTLLPFLLMKRQVEWMQWAYGLWQGDNDGITEKSRECGVSWCSVALAVALCLFRKGVKIGFGSRKMEYVDSMSDPKALLWKVREFTRCLPLEFRGDWDAKRDAPQMRVSFPATGSIIAGEIGDSIGRGDRTSLYVVDEAAHLEHPDLTDAALSATTNCRIDISSVNGMANNFAQRRWSGKIPVFIFDWTEDDRKDQTWLKKQEAKLLPHIFRQEVLRSYNASNDNQVIEAEWALAAVDAHVKLKIKPTGAKRSALDVADRGADKNAWVARHGVVLTHCEVWSGKSSDIYATAERAIALCTEHGVPDMDYDGDGLGAAIRGDARKINEERAAAVKAAPASLKARVPRQINVGQFRGSESPVFPTQRVLGPDGTPLDRTNEDFYANRKAQSYMALRYRFEQTWRALQGMPYDPDDIISLSSDLPDLTSIISELSQPVYKLNNVGKLLIDKQPDGVPSPNRSDGIMMLYAPRRQPMKIAQALLG